MSTVESSFTSNEIAAVDGNENSWLAASPPVGSTFQTITVEWMMGLDGSHVPCEDETSHFGREEIYNQTFTFESSVWFAAMSKSISELETIVLEKVKNELGREEQKESDTAIILMVVATFVSVLAASFIVYWQVKIAGSIAEQQLTPMEVSRVVSSFVPKAFLKTMGTRSIMQISTGQHVNVATTMVFSDIRNFTNLSERMSNEKLFFWLQRYFALMTRVNDTHKGTIDKFIGDAIFSFFPRPADAVRCGIDMQSVVVFLNSTLASENLVQLGVGIHHGVVAFGVFGDENLRTCTMVSSEVNLASRLEGLTKKYGVRILVSEQAMVQVDTENFKHQVMNPLDLAMGHVHDHDHPDAHQRAAAYHSEHHDDVADEQDVLDADDQDEEEASALGHRMLGEVSVKGSGRLVRIYEVFQADEVQVRKYKTKSKEIFTEAVRLQLKKAAGNRDSFKSHTSEYNPLRRRSDEDAAAAQEEAEIAAARSMSCSVVTHLESSQHPNAPDTAPPVSEDEQTNSPATDFADRPDRSPTALPHDLDTSSDTRRVRVNSFDLDTTNQLPTATSSMEPFCCQGGMYNFQATRRQVSTALHQLKKKIDLKAGTSPIFAPSQQERQVRFSFHVAGRELIFLVVKKYQLFVSPQTEVDGAVIVFLHLTQTRNASVKMFLTCPTVGRWWRRGRPWR